MRPEFTFPGTRAAWFELMAAAAEHNLPAQQANWLPGFPGEVLQAGTTGQAGRATLLEAFTFYEDTCLAFERTVGRPLGVGDKALDFGTGWGRILRFFLREVGAENCYGTDVNPGLVETCRELFRSDNFFVNPAFPPTSFDDNSFSLIVGYSVFSHLSEAACRAWMKEFFRILTPNGLVAVTTRGRWFFDYCEGLKPREDEGGYTAGLANLFQDFAAAKDKYDKGEIVHSTSDQVCDGRVLASSFYGETFIPKRWAAEAFRPLMTPGGVLCAKGGVGTSDSVSNAGLKRYADATASLRWRSEQGNRRREGSCVVRIGIGRQRAPISSRRATDIAASPQGCRPAV